MVDLQKILERIEKERERAQLSEAIVVTARGEYLELLSDYEKMARALEFYADKANELDSNGYIQFQYDNGELAREILAEVGSAND